MTAAEAALAEAPLVEVRGISKRFPGVRALDRVLLSGHYVVPLYNAPDVWMARWATIGRPEKPALTGAVTDSFWRAAP